MLSAARTYQTRVSVSLEQQASLRAYAAVFGRAERSLFARSRATGAGSATFKKAFMRSFGLTARQFNAVRVSVDGKVRAAVEARAFHITDVRERIRGTKKAVAALEKSLASASGERRERLERRVAGKRSRLVRLRERLAALEADERSGTVRICFGSRKLFRAQFSLAENGFESHAAWLSAWRAARSSQFMVLGSSDETAGCQGCVASVQPDGSLALRLRLPDGTHTVIEGVRFAYGQEVITNALALHAQQAAWKRLRVAKRPQAITAPPITYRFLLDKKGWRVFVTTHVAAPAFTSDVRLGAIGIDVGASTLAVTETDRHGNPLRSRVLPLCTYGKSAEQRQALIGDAAKQVVQWALDSGKPLVLEKLDFAKKRATLRERSNKHARMLSALAYRKIDAMIHARAFVRGVSVLTVNPAYSSLIGHYNFERRYGLNTDQSAALVLARRAQGHAERPIAPQSYNSHHQALPVLPVRNRDRNPWSCWRRVSRAKWRMKRSARNPARSDSRGPSAAIGPSPPDGVGRSGA